MKKARLIAFVFLTSIVFLTPWGTAWAGYTTTLLTNNSHSDSDPQINASGQVVWTQYDGHDYEIYLYSGGVTTQLTNNTCNDLDSQINDSGQVVWGGGAYGSSDGEIFLYAPGVGTIQLTQNAYFDSDPQINASGQVVWTQYDGHDYEIYLYSGGVTTQLASDVTTEWPQINDSGQVVWAESPGEIFLYSGGLTTQLTNSSGWYPQINNSGQVVWEGFDGNDDEIYLYSSGVTTQLTSNSDPDYAPQINNSGQVVWGRVVSDGYYSQSYDIYLYSGGVTTQLASDGVDRYPQINDSGQVVWYGKDYEIYLYSGGVTTRLTDNSYVNDSPQINNSGQVVWVGNSEIYLASPCSGGGRPSLALSHDNAFWESYADYTARELSVTMTLGNSGTNTAYVTMITGSSNTSGVILSAAVPDFVLGDIPGGAISSVTLKYHVPAGVVSFKTSVTATAQDLCGTTYSYPGPYPGT